MLGPKRWVVGAISHVANSLRLFFISNNSELFENIWNLNRPEGNWRLYIPTGDVVMGIIPNEYKIGNQLKGEYCINF